MKINPILSFASNKNKPNESTSNNGSVNNNNSTQHQSLKIENSSENDKNNKRGSLPASSRKEVPNGPTLGLNPLIAQVTVDQVLAKMRAENDSNAIPLLYAKLRDKPWKHEFLQKNGIDALFSILRTNNSLTMYVKF